MANPIVFKKGESNLANKESYDFNISSNAKGTEQGNAKSSLNISKEIEPGVKPQEFKSNNESFSKVQKQDMIPDEYDDMEIPDEHAIPQRIVVPQSTYIHESTLLKNRFNNRKSIKSVFIKRNSKSSLSDMSDISAKKKVIAQIIRPDSNSLVRQGQSLRK